MDTASATTSHLNVIFLFLPDYGILLFIAFPVSQQNVTARSLCCKKLLVTIASRLLVRRLFYVFLLSLWAATVIHN